MSRRVSSKAPQQAISSVASNIPDKTPGEKVAREAFGEQYGVR